jgi:hypothetical protein
MQFFNFIFLARSWAADKDVLTSRLSALAAHHTVRLIPAKHAELHGIDLILLSRPRFLSAQKTTNLLIS